MKTHIVIAAFIILCTSTLSLAADQSATVYNGSVFTEDVTWRGSVLVKGFVVVAPQATLRIDPGTVIRFAATDSGHIPKLVVQGRIHASGTFDRPIVMTSDQIRPARGAWGGIVLLMTEKRNLIEGTRIEYAETGIDLRYSSITLKDVSIVRSETAFLSHEGVVQMSGVAVSDSETGIEIINSEFDGRDTTVASCRRGWIMNKSAVVLVAPKVLDNLQTGLEADECRIKISGGEFAGNAFGARIGGGEGQITMSRFMKNRETALQLSGSRIKIQRCLFAGNSQDALRTEDGRAVLINNSFSTNGGYNLFNAGREVVSALQNWWGATDAPQIRQKIHDSFRDKNTGTVQFFPWLNEKPQLMP